MGSGCFRRAEAPVQGSVEKGERVPLLSSTRKAEQFARLLEGGGGGSGSGDLGTLQNLASRLASVPQPRPEFASALRERLMSEAVGTLPSAAGGAAGGGAAGGTGSGGTGSGGTGAGSTGTGAPGTGAGSTGSAASAVSTGGTAAGGSAASAITSATAPVWAQFLAGVAATAVAIGGVGLGASQSLPGDPLYGVKRQIEAIQLDLAGGRTDSALAQLGFARTRLSELSDLLGDREASAPLPTELQQRISTLLTDWAAETTRGTTALLGQLTAASGDVSAIRQKLTAFTADQSRALALIVQKLPDSRLQSYTGSAFAYLQRLDTALGNPVNLATLLPSLGLALPTTTAPTGTATPNPKPTDKTGTPTTSSGGGTGSTSTPTSVPTLPIPTNGTTTPRGGITTVPTTPSLPSVPTGNGPLPAPLGSTAGGVGSTVNGATGGVNKTVDGVLSGVTGNGPSLPLPTSVPTLPALGH